MGNTQPGTVNPSELRAEYGPAPWWSRERLGELVFEHELSTEAIADIWDVHPDTVRQWVNRHGLREGSA